MESVWMKIDTFHNQYKSILLLLHFGIGGLPFELVYKILKEYVYKPPFIRIYNKCSGKRFTEVYRCNGDIKEIQEVCSHQVYVREEDGNYYSYSYSSEIQIRKWLEDNNVSVPYHFYDEDD